MQFVLARSIILHFFATIAQDFDELVHFLHATLDTGILLS
jgi:hypothetical protein